MKLPGALRYVCCALLVLAGTAGILFSPVVGTSGGMELRSFTLNHVKDYAWGTAVATSELEVPFVQNERGLFFMHLFLAASLVTIFSGVHWFAILRRKVA